MAENELLELGTNEQTRSIKKASDVMPDVAKEIEARTKIKGGIPGIGTGLYGLDSLIGGLQDDRYIIIGARPSDGKSALAINMACNVAIELQTPTGIISAESSNKEIMTRVVASEGHIMGGHMAMGVMSGSDIQSLLAVGEKINPAPLYLYDAPNIRFGELKSVARQMVTLYKIKVLFVDYIQIIQWEDSRLAIHEQVAAVSRGLKQLARELKIPIVGLSQLKRDSEGREPELADLDYSKQLEQDGDVIVLIYHPKAKKDEDENAERESLLLVKKNRDGPKGAAHVQFRREYVKFYDSEDPKR
jgi:replicative DNA helicase